jgi:CHASE2 domain-containing sensor protein
LGGLMSTGLLIAFCAWYAPPSRSFLEAIAAGAAGFGCAIGVHFAEGYTEFVHLAPALVGALLFVTAVALEITGLRQADRKAGGQEARSAKDEARRTTRAV